MLLIISFSMITWEFKSSRIIINLTFISQSVHDQLIYCQKTIKLDKTSDHKLMKTVFYLQTSRWEMSKHRTWKKMNRKAIKRESKIIWILHYLNFTAEIEQYVKYLLQFTENLINKTVLWIKSRKKSVLW